MRIIMQLLKKIKEHKDNIELIFDTDLLTQVPLKVAMKFIEITESNHSLNNSIYVNLDKKTKEFVNQNKEKYEILKNDETKEFKKFSEVYFKELNSYIFLYNTEDMYHYLNRVFELESKFNNIKERAVTKISYKLVAEDDSNFNKVLQVKELDKLIENFGKSVALHSLILFKDYLNEEYKRKTKTSQTPYGISNEIKIITFNEKTQEHEHLKSFKDKDYFLTLALNNQAKEISSLEEIFKLVLMHEDLKNELYKENKIKNKL